MNNPGPSKINQVSHSSDMMDKVMTCAQGVGEPKAALAETKWGDQGRLVGGGDEFRSEGAPSKGSSASPGQPAASSSGW